VTTTTDDLTGTRAVLSKLARELDSGGRSRAWYETLSRGFWLRNRERIARIDALTSADAINPWKSRDHGDQ